MRVTVVGRRDLIVVGVILTLPKMHSFHPRVDLRRVSRRWRRCGAFTLDVIIVVATAWSGRGGRGRWRGGVVHWRRCRGRHPCRRRHRHRRCHLRRRRARRVCRGLGRRWAKILRRSHRRRGHEAYTQGVAVLATCGGRHSPGAGGQVLEPTGGRTL